MATNRSRSRSEGSTRSDLSGNHTIQGDTYDPTTDKEDLPPAASKTPQQLNFLRKAIAKSVFLKDLDEPRLEAVLMYLKPKEVHAGQDVIKFNHPGDTMFIVESGTFDEVRGKKGDFVKKVQPGEIFKELSLLGVYGRDEWLKCNTDGVLWSIDRHLYHRIVSRLAHERYLDNVALLKSVPMLAKFAAGDQIRLTDAIIGSKIFDKGGVVFKEGDEGDGVYFIREGEVILKTKEWGEIATMYPGSHFGELTLITNLPRPYTAMTDSARLNVAFISRDSFKWLADQEQYTSV